MRAFPVALALALAASGAVSGCSSSEGGVPKTPPACTLGALGAACSSDAACCSGNCQSSMCVEAAGSCEADGAPCGTPSECCSGACNGTCVDPGSGTCAAVGASCTSASECCTYQCEGPLGAKTCTEPVGQCVGVGGACSGNAQCCNGNCASGICAVPTGGSTCRESGACAADSECCSGVCSGGSCTPAMFCELPGEPCGSDAQCCSLNCSGGTCSSTVCRQIGEPCSSGGVCCSGVCGLDSRCAALPSGSTGATCRTLGEACASGSECCSTNCTGGTCKPAYTCNATGDICYRSEDCCSGLCAPPAQPGQPGRCKDAPGGCALDGYPCTSDSGCCTRRCVDLGTGAKVCQPSGGCRLNGNYCDSTASCCNVNHLVPSSQWIACDPQDHVCDNGGSCNPPGDICGLGANASQNCCFGKKDVCRYDSNGIPRCFGGPPSECGDNGCRDDGPCPKGWDGNNPMCCIPVGTGPESICQFRDQCCGFAPCVPDATGVLHCTAVSACKPKGASCSGAGDTSCCEGATCQNVAEIGWVCSDGTAGQCQPLGGDCTANAQCCSGLCSSQKCATACVPADGRCTVNGDCCSGLSCEVPPGATSGLCKGGGGPTCSATGQGCATDTDCCTYGQTGGDLCLGGVCTTPSCSETSQACTSDGDCCTGLRCWMLDPYEQQVACDPASGACFCNVEAGTCPVEGEPCSTLVPCCEGYCGPNAGWGACTSMDPADCTCKSIG